MPFFEALVGRFYEGVETDPILRPLYPEPDLAGARHRLTLFLAQYWGGPHDLRPGARPPAPADAPRPVRDRAGGARSLARPHARGHDRARAAARRRGGAGALLRDGRRGDAQPRLTRRRPGAVSEAGRPPGTLVTAGDTERRAISTMAEATDETGSPAAGRAADDEPTKRGKTVHGEAANAGHRVLAPDDAEVEAYLETALKAPTAERSPADRPIGTVATTPGHRRRPRLRQPVRPADRATRPRARRLLRAAAPRHAVRGAGATGHARDHPLGRPDVRLRPRRAAAGSGDLERRDPGPGHLLRRPDDGPRARRRRPPDRPSRVRPGQRDDHRRTTGCSPASSASSRSG